ncbi:MAG: hypothetical protein IJD16_04330 [Desulfovibrio sp.]|nr:hypothetical protein [Desulfovibrio sp.]
MEEIKQLSEKELEAQKYISFYEFWLFNYCVRSYFQTLEKHIPEIDDIDDKEIYAERIFKGHPLSNFNMNMRIGEYTNYKNMIPGFLSDVVSWEYPETLLCKLYRNEQIVRWYPIYNHHTKKDYFKILGTRNAHLSPHGKLRGHIIVDIDITAPIEFIFNEIEKIKKHTFLKFPNFVDCTYGIDNCEGNYILSKKVIKKITRCSFAEKDHARAIGLWFYDVIDCNKFFSSFAEAWNVIHIKAKGFEISKTESEDNVPLLRAKNRETEISCNVPSTEVLARLGYAGSDEATLRRIYNRTKKCVEDCEVLSLK